MSGFRNLRALESSQLSASWTASAQLTPVVLDGTYQALHDICGKFYDDCPAITDLGLSPKTVGICRNNSIAVALGAGHLFARFLRIVHYLNESQQCAAPRCTRTLAEGPLYRCTGCRRVLFWSRCWLKQAWTCHGGPHREVCHALATLTAYHQLPKKDVAEWMTSDDRLSLTAHRPIIHPPVQFVVTHFRNLKPLQMETLGRCARD
jgi:hypothetical protein